MNGNKQKLPMQDRLGFDNADRCHVKKHPQYRGINKAPNDNPRNIKAGSDEIGQEALGEVALVNDSSGNEEPCIDLDRQDCSHEPTILWPCQWRNQVDYGNKVMLEIKSECGMLCVAH